jgi:hypothetical protein
MSKSLIEYKNLIQKSHEYWKEKFSILYEKEINKNISDEEKSELQEIRITKWRILMKWEKNISFSREEATILMDNWIVAIKAIINYFTKKKATPFRHGVIDKNHKEGLKVNKSVKYTNNTFDGWKEVELVGYKLNKLSQMY